MADRLILVIMIDALGARIVRDAGAFDFLEAPDGPLPSVCGYSSACIPSLFTGRLPVDHGHWAMYLRDPGASVFKPFRPWIWFADGLMGRKRITREMIKRALGRMGITGYFSLYEVPPRLLPQFDLCEQRNIFAPGAFPGLDTPFDVARARGLRMRVWSWSTPEERNRAELRESLRAGEDDFLFFYSPQLDAVMHRHGTRSAETRACLDEFAGFTQEMLKLARNAYGDVRLFVFGDHGMADVDREVELMPRIEALGLRVPQEALYFIDSTMARFWFFRPDLRERVEGLLGEGDFGGRVLDDEECGRLGVLFPDRRYGELIYIADPGTIFVPSFMGLTGCRAMHGYHPEDVDGDTLLLSNVTHARVQSIMDIGPLLGSELTALAAER